jgi:hypothetical protein
MHVLAYAEVLFRWKLLHKRIELLKAVDPFLRLPPDSYFNSDHSQLGTLRHLRRLNVRCPIPLLTYVVVVVGQVYPSYALSAVDLQPLKPNQPVLPVARASECPDVLCAVFPSKARRVIPRPVFFFLTKHALRPLLQLLGMSPRQPSILLEVAPERHLLNWLSMPLPYHSSGLAQ